MDQIANMPSQKKPASTFVIDFVLALFLTAAANFLYFWGSLSSATTPAGVALQVAPAILIVAFRFYQNRIMSWGAVLVAAIFLLLAGSMNGLGSALNGM